MTGLILRHPERFYHLLVLVLLVYLVDQLCTINDSAHIKSEDCEHLSGTPTWPDLAVHTRTWRSVRDGDFLLKSKFVIAVFKNALVASSAK
jgi:hypothetical protein